ncbi:hypothetical protein DFJ74DRAFT_490759 [Hyaloraphidium curvatum]|nr:hypothetical protein DFJ74DRAFT_490759 [Hyaloraphidium curvatum]
MAASTRGAVRRQPASRPRPFVDHRGGVLGFYRDELLLVFCGGLLWGPFLGFLCLTSSDRPPTPAQPRPRRPTCRTPSCLRRRRISGPAAEDGRGGVGYSRGAPPTSHPSRHVSRARPARAAQWSASSEPRRGSACLGRGRSVGAAPRGFGRAPPSSARPQRSPAITTGSGYF